jgi:hypothetical protein
MTGITSNMQTASGERGAVIRAYHNTEKAEARRHLDLLATRVLAANTG